MGEVSRNEHRKESAESHENFIGRAQENPKTLTCGEQRYDGDEQSKSPSPSTYQVARNVIVLNSSPWYPLALFHLQSCKTSYASGLQE